MWNDFAEIFLPSVLKQTYRSVLALLALLPLLTLLSLLACCDRWNSLPSAIEHLCFD